MASKKKLTGPGRPTLLAPVHKKEGTLQVVIETPKRSRNKFAFDEKQNVFAPAKVLPAGMALPYDFGFVPSTLAEDGDPTVPLRLASLCFRLRA
jgi:inorganic pyrophosphatase